MWGKGRVISLPICWTEISQIAFYATEEIHRICSYLSKPQFCSLYKENNSSDFIAALLWEIYEITQRLSTALGRSKHSTDGSCCQYPMIPDQLLQGQWLRFGQGWGRCWPHQNSSTVMENFSPAKKPAGYSNSQVSLPGLLNTTSVLKNWWL